jgi:hypothetical protein
MRVLVVTVPARLYFNWLCEGDLPDDPPEEKGSGTFTRLVHQLTGPRANVST